MCFKFPEVYHTASDLHHIYFCFLLKLWVRFFTDEDVALKGIVMPLDGTNVVDVEFVDDASLYLDDQITDMHKMYTTLQAFYTTSSASIN